MLGGALSATRSIRKCVGTYGVRVRVLFTMLKGAAPTIPGDMVSRTSWPAGETQLTGILAFPPAQLIAPRSEPRVLTLVQPNLRAALSAIHHFTSRERNKSCMQSVQYHCSLSHVPSRSMSKRSLMNVCQRKILSAPTGHDLRPMWRASSSVSQALRGRLPCSIPQSRFAENWPLNRSQSSQVSIERNCSLVRWYPLQRPHR